MPAFNANPVLVSLEGMRACASLILISSRPFQSSASIAGSWPNIRPAPKTSVTYEACPAALPSSAPLSEHVALLPGDRRSFLKLLQAAATCPDARGGAAFLDGRAALDSSKSECRFKKRTRTQ